MAADEMSGWLMFMTFGVVLAIAIGGFAWFLRRRSNREAAKEAFDLDGKTHSAATRNPLDR